MRLDEEEIARRLRRAGCSPRLAGPEQAFGSL